jgi:MerR family copper efflux transcriptional regulator
LNFKDKNKNKENLKIGEIAGDTGLPVSTIRYYVRLGLLKEIYRTPGGVRVFNRKGTVKKLKDIKEKSESQSLKKIKKLLESKSE